MPILMSAADREFLLELHRDIEKARRRGKPYKDLVLLRDLDDETACSLPKRIPRCNADSSTVDFDSGEPCPAPWRGTDGAGALDDTDIDMPALNNGTTGGANGAVAASRKKNTPCMSSIREMFETMRQRMTTGQVLDWMNSHRKGYSESTITKALVYMNKKSRELDNAVDSRGQGYGLAEWSSAP